MKKIKMIFTMILLIILFVGCGDMNPQKQSSKVSEHPMTTKEAHSTLSGTTKSALEQEKESEEFSTKRKLKNKKVKIGSFMYTYSELEDGTVWIKKISFDNEDDIKILKIPTEIDGCDVTVLGHSYGTGIYDMLLDDKDYDGCDENIFGIMLEESFVEKQPQNIYKRTKNIEQIILPSTIKVLGLDTFEYLPEYQILDIGDCVANNLEFTVVNYEWSRIKVSKTNPKYKSIRNMVLTKDEKELVKAFGQCDKLRVPNGVEIIKENAFLSIKANKLFISSSVNEIQAGEYNVHNNIMRNYIKDVSVSKDNKVYGKLKNALYKKSNKELILLCNKKQTIIIPEGIRIAKDFCCNGYSAGKFRLMSIKRFEFPQSMAEYAYTIDCDRKATVIFKSKKCPKLGYPLFMGKSSLEICVPHGSKKEYRKKLKDVIGENDKIIELD